MEMTDSTSGLRTGYYNLLNGNLVALNKSVPVYSIKTPVEKDVVVVISSISETEDEGNKDLWGKRVTVNVDIQHYIVGTGSVTTTVVDAISSQIQKLIKPNKGSNGEISAGPNWYVISTNLDSANHLTLNTATGQLVRKIMVFQHQLKQIG